MQVSGGSALSHVCSLQWDDLWAEPRQWPRLRPESAPRLIFSLHPAPAEPRSISGQLRPRSWTELGPWLRQRMWPAWPQPSPLGGCGLTLQPASRGAGCWGWGRLGEQQLLVPAGPLPHCRWSLGRILHSRDVHGPLPVAGLPTPLPGYRCLFLACVGSLLSAAADGLYLAGFNELRVADVRLGSTSLACARISMLGRVPCVCVSVCPCIFCVCISMCVDALVPVGRRLGVCPRVHIAIYL